MDTVLYGVAAVIAASGLATWLVFCGVAILRGTRNAN